MGQIKSGVGASGGGQGSAPNLQNAGAASAALTAAMAQANIKRASEIIAGIRQAQVDAKLAATGKLMDGSSVPNGLRAGGLEVYNPGGQVISPGNVPVTWSGVSALAETRTATDAAHDAASAAAAAAVNITQSQPNAYLYWNKFNVGPKTTVNFDQSAGGGNAGTWIAFNKVMSPTDPSHIFGSINAQGQVYVLNQNGILFHNGSSVNTHALVASTLPINTYFAGDALRGIQAAGIANNAGDQFLFSASALRPSQAGNDAFDPLATTVASDAVRGTSVVRVAAGSGYAPGDKVSGSGIAPGTIVASVTRANPGYDSVTLSAPTTAAILSGTLLSGTIPASAIGGIVVERGVSLSSPVSSDATGGRVVLVAPSVANAGTIMTPSGQTILAAGLQVGLVPHPSSDASLRGLDVFIGKVSDENGGTRDKSPRLGIDGLLSDTLAPGNVVGTVVNSGLIEVPLGEAALVGKSLLQGGGIISSTGVSFNGRMDLMASFNAAVTKPTEVGNPYSYDSAAIGGTTGSVEFGPNSASLILPDLSSGDTVIGAVLALPSVISVLAQSVHLDSGALLLAPGATVNPANPAINLAGSALTSGIGISAGNWYNNNRISSFVLGSVDGQNPGSIVLDDLAKVSAAGTTGVSVDSSQYLQTIQLRGPELADSPLQRTSVIRGKDITVDLRVTGSYNGNSWVGTPLGDLSGYVGLIQRGVGQLTTPGGSVSLAAGGSVSIAGGASVDVSGGWFQYAGGSFSVTRLTSQGRIIPISQATPDLVYDGIAPAMSVNYAPYISGSPGGSLAIQAPSMILDGSLYGTVVNGPLQIQGVGKMTQPTKAATLSLQVVSSVRDPAQGWLPASIAPVAVDFGSSPDDAAHIHLGGAAPDDPLHTQMGAGLFGSYGFGSLIIDDHDGSVTLDKGTRLDLSSGASAQLSISASSVDIEGKVISPGGAVAINAYDLSYAMKALWDNAAANPSAADAVLSAGRIKLGSESAIDVSGLVSNVGSSADATANHLAGGSIALSSLFMMLLPGSDLNVSGGGIRPIANPSKVTYGSAGSISLTAGQDITFPTVSLRSTTALGILSGGGSLEGVIRLDASMEGYAGLVAQPGSLSLTLPAIQIGGLAANPGVTTLDPGLFNRGGFGRFKLTGVGIASPEIVSGTSYSETPGVLMTSGTILHPVVQSEFFGLNGMSLYNADPLMAQAVSLSINSTGLTDTKARSRPIIGQTVLQENSSIILDPRALLSSASSVTPSLTGASLSIGGGLTQIEGAITVPGGVITMKASKSYPLPTIDALASSPGYTLVVGGSALISAAGEAVGITDPLGLGRSLGGVLQGGSVSIGTADAPANAELLAGSKIDVRGASGSFLGVGLDGRISRAATESDGGTVFLFGSEELSVLGSLSGGQGGPSAAGGTLVVSSGRFYTPLQQADSRDTDLGVVQDVASLPAFIQARKDAGVLGMGFVAARTIMDGKFGSVELDGNLLFGGNVSLSLPSRITAATAGVLEASGSVNLTAPYVVLGKAFANPLLATDPLNFNVLGNDPSAFTAPVAGTGSLLVSSHNSDLGTVLLNGVGSAVIGASRGVIRGDGAIALAGDLTLRAAQIQPLTETSFMATAYSGKITAGKITVEQDGPPLPLPYSAGGTISLYASVIEQAGTLVSPFGRINLGWNGNGSSPVDPVTGAGVTDAMLLHAVPAASIPITASLTLSPGSITSVSAKDPLSDKALSIPYGILMNGTEWIDPAGNNITATGPLPGGIASKGVSLSAVSIKMDQSPLGLSTLDLRGGGELDAFQWISGLRGNVDVTSPSLGGFAILPGTAPELFPISPFAQTSLTGGDPGITPGNVKVGDVIYLTGGGDLAAGLYTLLPSRYALLPKAYLIFPKGTPSDATSPSVVHPDGSMTMTGTRYNTLDHSRTMPGLTALFEVDSPAVLDSRAEYTVNPASTLLPSTSGASSVKDAAGLSVQALSSMSLKGLVLSSPGTGGRGANIDLSSPANFQVSGPSAPVPSAGTIVLDAATLSSWNAGSLMIGGYRTVSPSGMTVTPTSDLVSVNDAGATLSAQDLILVSLNGVSISEGSALSSSGVNSSLPLSVSGNGALIRLSCDPAASVTRVGNDLKQVSGYTLEDRVGIEAASVILDSSGVGKISTTALLGKGNISLDAGRISLNFDGSFVSDALNLSGQVLSTLSESSSLSLSSYSVIGFRNSGAGASPDAHLGSASLGSLSLHAGELMGDRSGSIKVQAENILLDNRGGVIDRESSSDYQPQASAALPNSLGIMTSLLTLGEGDMAIGGFGSIAGIVSSGVEGAGKGTLSVSGNLALQTPVLVAGSLARTTVVAAGDLVFTAPVGTAPSPSAGLGATLSLKGASVSLGTKVILPSGALNAEATLGDLTLSSIIEAGGVANHSFDWTSYTDGGSVFLTSDLGKISMTPLSSINLSAEPGGGSAGTLSLRAPNAPVTLLGSVTAAAQNGLAGSLVIDEGSLSGTFSSQEERFADFTQSQNIRVRSGNVTLDGTTVARTFILSADLGSITVTGTVNASGPTGGDIRIFAGRDLTVVSGSRLNVRGDLLDDAGKAGVIDLEAGNSTANSTQRNVTVGGAPMTELVGTGSIDLSPGALLDLGIGAADVAGGILLLRAPQNATHDGLGIAEISSTILGASAIRAQGVYTLDAAVPDDPRILSGTYDYLNQNPYGIPQIEVMAATALAEATSYATAVNAHNPFGSSAYAPLIHFMPGIQLINSLGSLELGTDLDLSASRYGTLLPVLGSSLTPAGSSVGADAGFLTLRAKGDILLNASISDGFASPAFTASLIPLVSKGGAVTGQSSWSYTITAGADISSADPSAVLSLPAGSLGSVKLGIVTVTSNMDLVNQDQTANMVEDTLSGNFQVIRTGVGDISVNAGRDIQFLNQFSTIYTSGALVADQSLGGSFDLPLASSYTQQFGDPSQIGAPQTAQSWKPQFTAGGGNVALRSGGDITHLQAVQDPGIPGMPLIDSDGTLELTADSSRQLPTSWISRRGIVTSDGSWQVIKNKMNQNEVASTAWWVVFSNFFEGVGALGGGNIVLDAGHAIRNVDAAIATQGRLAARDGAGNPILPSKGIVTETGGGDLSITTGGDLDAGVYYVEKGTALLRIGGSIVSNATRDVNGSYLGDLLNDQAPGTQTSTGGHAATGELWLPTTFFEGGNSSIRVTTRGSALLGPVGDLFLQAPGIQNDVKYKGYFSTYGEGASFSASALGGDLELRTTLSSTAGTLPAVQAWESMNSFFDTGLSLPAQYQPWVRSSELNASDANLSPLSSLLPGRVSLTSVVGNIVLEGDLTLNPSPQGSLVLQAGRGVEGIYQVMSGATWASSTVNVSDAVPSTWNGSLIPSPTLPYAQYNANFKNPGYSFTATSFTTFSDYLLPIGQALAESGSVTGNNALIQNKLALHAKGLHASVGDPIRIYASAGDISGLTLYAPLMTKMLAGGAISDVSLYIQNNNPKDVSVISAGGDIMPYDNSATLLQLALKDAGANGVPTPLAGDIQISGPGTLEVLAGGSINLGTGDVSRDGTGAGITSIGNARNPYLPFDGADLVVAAGISWPSGLGDAKSSVQKFLGAVAAGADPSGYYGELVSSLAGWGNETLLSDLQKIGAIEGIASSSLSDDEKSRLALGLFYLVLRDTGRNYNKTNSSGYRSYAAGEKAIESLFVNPGQGDIVLNARNIRTKSGGSVLMLAPGGGIELASYAVGLSQAPPGIVTEHGGSVNIFTKQSVSLGIGRIFTLRGGDVMIWSDKGDIAAGSSAKTVASAPPTRVLIDPQSGDILTDLAGLATGGGIGVLATVKDAPVGNVDLIAVSGIIDAGDAGIRSSGNLNLAATKILNADNIAVGGVSVGAPPASAPASAPPTAAPPAAAPPASASTAAAANNSSAATASKNTSASQGDETPSVYSIDILGYGGGEEEESEKAKAADASVAPVQASL
jgi:filamentous hemagglutinin